MDNPTMNFRRFFWLGWILAVALLASTAASAVAQEWRIPVAGNFFRTAPEAGNGRAGRDGSLTWTSAEETYSVYFHVNQPSRLTLSAELKSAEAASRLQVSVADTTFEVDVPGTDSSGSLPQPTDSSGSLREPTDGSGSLREPTDGRGSLREPTKNRKANQDEYPLGDVDVTDAGYVRVDFRGLERLGKNYAGVVTLIVASDSPNLEVHFVRNNDDNMFYWGRRGPSVHLTYQMPKDVNVEYAYSEITVPVGEDPIGSYFMANGFGEGYFGFQVNSATERRVLFSVWSPFQTDDPKSIPPEQRIEALERGPDVKIGEFGNEGSGGQSFLVYPWRAGQTYRFLTRVVPDGNGSTIYSAWFGDKAADEWRLIARFRRPQTKTHLRGFHSFLESFDPSHGHIHRRARHHNVWVRDTDGHWHVCESARLSVDGTGGQKHRLDFGGGVDGAGWFMENCGFFSGKVAPGTSFKISSPKAEPPALPQ